VFGHFLPSVLDKNDMNGNLILSVISGKPIFFLDYGNFMQGGIRIL